MGQRPDPTIGAAVPERARWVGDVVRGPGRSRRGWRRGGGLCDRAGGGQCSSHRLASHPPRRWAGRGQDEQGGQVGKKQQTTHVDDLRGHGRRNWQEWAVRLIRRVLSRSFYNPRSQLVPVWPWVTALGSRGLAPSEIGGPGAGGIVAVAGAFDYPGDVALAALPTLVAGAAPGPAPRAPAPAAVIAGWVARCAAVGCRGTMG